MKSFKYLLYTAILGTVLSCTYDFPETQKPSSGGADFSKYVAIGNSLTAGYMDGALYTRGQQNSYPSIIARQMQTVGGGAFVQPDINSENGFFGLAGSTPLGRLQLKYGCPNGTSPAPSPIIPGSPIEPYSAGPVGLNNFGVPGLKLIYASNGLAASQNPYYSRWFASPTEAASTSPLALASASNPTFFTMWLGSNDAIAYATSGGTVPATSSEYNTSPAPPKYLGVSESGPIPNPAYPDGADYYITLKQANQNGTDQNDLTPVETFGAAYNASLTAMLGASAKGVIGTIPDVTSIPYFTTIPAGAFKIPLNLGDTVTSGPYAGMTYAQILNGLYFQYGFTTQAEFEDYGGGQLGPKRVFTPDANNYLTIETFDNAGTRIIRQIDPVNDLVILSIPTDSLGLGPIMKCSAPTGTLKAGWGLVKNLPLTAQGTIDIDNVDPNSIKPYPIPSSFILDKSEKEVVVDRVIAFNQMISSAVNDRVALVDFYAVFKEVALGTTMINGINFTPSIAPPYGAFSLDGVHPNARGYGFVANKFIEAINAKFGSSIPLVNPNDYPSNDLPTP